MAVDTGWKNGSPSLDGSLGDGTLKMRYRRANGSFLFVLQFVMGSTTTFSVLPVFDLGEGLPFPDVASTSGFDSVVISNPSDGPMGVVPCHARDVKAGTDDLYHGVAILYERVLYSGENPEAAGLSTMVVRPMFDASWSDTHPFTWGAGDYMIVGNAIETFDN